MPRKALLGLLILLSLTLPVSARELWSNLAGLVDGNGSWSDITLCSYAPSGNGTAGGSAAANSNAPGTVVAADPACDPCQMGMRGSLLGGGLAGQGGLWGPLPSEQGAEDQAWTGRQVLFPGQSGWVDRNARGTTWMWIAPAYGSAALTGIDDSRFGVAEGLISGYRLTPGLGVYGAITFVHDEEMTLFLGTVGVQKFGDRNGASLLDRASLWVFWDNAADTLDSDLGHFQQLRFNIGVVGPAGAEVGVSFSVSLDEPREYFLIPVGGTTFLSTGGSVIGPYVRYSIGIFDLTAMLGYSGQSEAGVLGLGGKAWLTENVAIFGNGNTGGAEGTDNPSSLMAGIMIGGGRADTETR